MPTNITVVINLHREGNAALPSIISAWRSIEAARAVGLNCELLLVLDSADEATITVADRWGRRGAIALHVQNEDLGASRNSATEVAEGEWVAFLDADDLWGEDWLTRAHSAATQAGPVRAEIEVWHPAVNIIFGDHHSLLHHIESTDPKFSFARFRLHNAWTALSFVHRSTLLTVPYPSNNLADGFGFEDWSWNEEILRRGGRHLVVPETCHFIQRTTSSSLLGQSQAALRTRYSRSPDDPDATRHVVSNTPSTDFDGASAATHVDGPIEISPEVAGQVRLAGAIEPAVLQTVDPDRLRGTLPQNFNTHLTTAQHCLEQVEVVASTAPLADVAELLGWTDLLKELSDLDRAKVVAEVLLDPRNAHRRRGISAHITHAHSVFPQLRAHK